MEADKPHYIGHRQRLKEKLLKHSAKHLADYELVELLLFAAIPRKDVKPLAKNLLKHFGSLSNLINSDKDKLALLEGTNENVCVSLYLVQELISRILKEKIESKNSISSWAALLDYLKFSMGNLKVEQFRTLFLNKKNILIADEVMGIGTIDQAPVYPREIIKRALFHEAGAIILVHNHPSGSSKPSKADLELTNKIVETCKSVNVTVHDHVIIADGQYYSFKSNMLL
ncbi:MAG: JAB domain-containing protein [Rickettsiaceae bacterium]|nr:MAG: JAB domain-containing protein [Rickettsiaceae bacterium]